MKTLFSLLLIMSLGLSAMTAQHADCATAFRICAMDKYSFAPNGPGHEQEQLTNLKSNQSFSETNSVWLFWDVKENGEFIFELSPERSDDDIDFTVYRASGGDCGSLKQVRSVLSGANLPYFKNSDACLGTTGLSYTSKDKNEATGCKKGQDNFVQFIAAESYERYYVHINNYSSDLGFDFDISGSLAIDNSACLQEDNIKESIETITLYPNPVSAELFISISASSDISDVSIIDIMGRSVMVLDPSAFQQKNTKKTDIRLLSSGTYIVRAETANVVLEKRFVKL